MVSLSIPDGHREERIYAMHVLLYEFLGLHYHVQVQPSLTDYIIEYNGNRLHIADAFFANYASSSDYLTIDAIPSTASICQHPQLTNIVLIYGEDTLSRTGEDWHCGVDIVAGTFFMLTRWEENVRSERDHHDRFPAHASLIGKHKLLKRPVVDEYTALLKYLLVSMGLPEQMMKKSEYRAHLTVDVDTARLWTSGWQAIRHILGSALRARSMATGIAAWKSFRETRSGGPDPYDRFAYFNDLARKNKSALSYFFMVGGKHKYDPGQPIGKEHVRELCLHLHEQGASVGLHPSYCTSGDEELFHSEAEAFEAATKIAVCCGRQHYLRTQVPGTWRAWASIGASWESSMAYPEEIGFRCGTSRTYPVFDVLSRIMPGICEKPLLIMDVTLNQYCQYTPEEAISQCLEVRQQVEAHNGEFVVLWHNSSFYSNVWKGYQAVLEKIIETP